MSAIILHRIDAVKNMRRFYKLDVQPDARPARRKPGAKPLLELVK